MENKKIEGASNLYITRKNKQFRSTHTFWGLSNPPHNVVRSLCEEVYTKVRGVLAALERTFPLKVSYDYNMLTIEILYPTEGGARKQYRMLHEHITPTIALFAPVWEISVANAENYVALLRKKEEDLRSANWFFQQLNESVVTHFKRKVAYEGHLKKLQDETKDAFRAYIDSPEFAEDLARMGDPRTDIVLKNKDKLKIVLNPSFLGGSYENLLKPEDIE